MDTAIAKIATSTDFQVLRVRCSFVMTHTVAAPGAVRLPPAGDIGGLNYASDR
jgi:hypothetical protein